MSPIAQNRIFKEATTGLLELLCSYFRVEMDGLERLPRKGPAIIIANHSGFTAIDAVLLAYLIHARTGRKPRIQAHRAYFEWFGWLRVLAHSLGLREAHVSSAVETLRAGNLLIIFPEGEAGNFKSSLHRYELQHFHSGFIRAALKTGAPVIPCVIIGAEESNLNLGNINLSRWKKRLRIPLPINLIPLPAKWKIQFLPPLEFPASIRRGGVGMKMLDAMSEQTRRGLQRAVRRQLRARPYIYFPPRSQERARARRRRKLA